jgi:hypothetical protein
MSQTDEELLAHEVECHRFTEPLQLSKQKPSRLRRAVVRATTGKVWFRVGWTCPHLKAVLISAEKEMLLKGELAEHLDIYQLQGNAGPSAGTHALPGAADLGQTSDAQIDILRLNGGDFQKRTPDQGFVLHAHGFAQGCNCGSGALLAQRSLWNRGFNGLVNMGRIIGRWPTKDWKTAVAERGKIIMALADDIANKVVARQGRNPSPADIWNWGGIPVSPHDRWGGGHIVSHMMQHQATVDRNIAALAAQVAQIKAAVNGLVATEKTDVK